MVVWSAWWSQFPTLYRSDLPLYWVKTHPLIVYEGVSRSYLAEYERFPTSFFPFCDTDISILMSVHVDRLREGSIVPRT